MSLVKEYGKTTAMFSLLLFFLFSRGFIWTDKLYYLFIAALVLIIFIGWKETLNDILEIKRRQLKSLFIKIYMIFGIYAFITAIWADYPAISILRSIILLLLVIGVYAAALRLKNINFSYTSVFAPLAIFTVITSLFSLIFQLPGDYWSGGNGLGLKGFSVHQNTLGSISFLCSSVFVFFAIKEFKSGNRSISKISFLLTLSLLIVVILGLTSSRGSAAAFLIFISAASLLEIGVKKSLFLFAFVGVILLISLQIGFIKDSVENLVYKKADKIYSSREAMYTASVKAALNGGLYGIGYGMSDTSFVKNVPGEMQGERFVREKGSTFLALAEETGIVGAILFYLPVGMVFWRAVKRKNDERRVKTLWQSQFDANFDKPGLSLVERLSVTNEKSVECRVKSEDTSTSLSVTNDKIERDFLISILIAMTVHMQIEAWGVGVGSVMLPVYLFFQFRLSNLMDGG